MTTVLPDRLGRRRLARYERALEAKLFEGTIPVLSDSPEEQEALDAAHESIALEYARARTLLLRHLDERANFWRPIATLTPAAGDFFLVCRVDADDFDCSVAVVCVLAGGGFGQYLPDDANEHLPYLEGEPTHWAPLPKPPVE